MRDVAKGKHSEPCVVARGVVVVPISRDCDFQLDGTELRLKHTIAWGRR